MDNKIDKLKTDVDDIKNSLNELKNNVSLSEDEKKKQAETLKSKAETTKKEIEKEIHDLESKTDDESKKQKEEAETLLNSFNEIMSLYASILNSQESEEGEEEIQEEKKGFFKKTKEWVGEQWDDVWDKEKWKEEGGKNLLRTAGFAVTGVGAIALTVKGIKKLWNLAFGDKDDEENEEDKEKKSKENKEKKEEKKKKRKERREERRKRRKERREDRPWRQKFLIGSAVAGGTVVGGVQIYKHRNKISSWVKEKLGLALSFDEAMYSVEAEVRNGINSDNNFGEFSAHFEGMSYDENTQEISSFGQKTKINKSNKTIDGEPMNEVQFASWEELFHAVNIVNFAKRELRGRGANETPFIVNKRTGDIDFSLSDKGKTQFVGANGSNFWTMVLGLGGAGGGGLLGGYFLGLKGGLTGAVAGGLAGYTLGSVIDNTSTMGRACATVAKGANLQKFVSYLNKQKDENGKSLWEIVGEQRINPDETPINQVIDNGKEGSERGGLLSEIEKSYGEDQTGRRNLEILWSEDKPNDYVIKSYYNECKVTIEGLPSKKGETPDYSKITKIHIKKYNDSDWGDGLDIDFPKTEEGLKEAIMVANLTNMIRNDWSKKGGEEFPFDYGKYKTPFSFEIDVAGMGTNYMGGTTILNHDTLKEKYPTLHKDLTEFPSTASAMKSSKKFQTRMNNQARKDESTGSQYIKFLHQMRSSNGGQLWKKVG